MLLESRGHCNTKHKIEVIVVKHQLSYVSHVVRNETSGAGKDWMLGKPESNRIYFLELYGNGILLTSCCEIRPH